MGHNGFIIKIDLFYCKRLKILKMEGVPITGSRLFNSLFFLSSGIKCGKIGFLSCVFLYPVPALTKKK